MMNRSVQKLSGDVSSRIFLAGGRAEVGTDQVRLPLDGEGPRRFVRLRSFWIDAAAVTNERFACFVNATGYVTEAEHFGWSYVFHSAVPQDLQECCGGASGAEWWRRVDGAYWSMPEGPGSDIVDRIDHPVVQISWNDATAFARWAGGRLPTEAEWEHAARGGLQGCTYPWGDEEPDDTSFQPCNIWQGEFPHHNSVADGFTGTAPVRAFEPNGYGLFNMVGNAWEWCKDPFRVRSLRRAARQTNARAAIEGYRVLKGGSYLCHKSYCHRYRIAARTGNAPDSTTGHVGFRLVYESA